MLATVVFAVPFAGSTAEAVAVERPAEAGGDEGLVSRPDIAAEVPPELTTTTTGREDPGLLFASPGTGPDSMTNAMYDNGGDLVWWGSGRNLTEMTYQGETVLCLYRDDGEGGHEYVLLDSSYTEIAAFGVSGYSTDTHDIAFSRDGSRVMMLGDHAVASDLSEYGGPADALVLDVIVQEQDITTGEVTFEWSALDHIPLDETHWPLTLGLADYVHANSLEYDTDGDLLMSARNTSTVYKIDLDSGDIVWRFGGENSDFTFADDADMPANQHDARRRSDGSLSVFDNGEESRNFSRGAIYDLDEETMTAELVTDLRTEEGVYSSVTGSNRKVANGNQLVSYGASGQIVEFAGTEPVFTASFPEDVYTYRAERAVNWRGTPAAPPDVAWRDADADADSDSDADADTDADTDADGTRELYMSWNGATEVDSWRIEVGGEVVDTVAKTGFETVAEVTPPEGAGEEAGAEDAWRISALDNAGNVLGSRTLPLTERLNPTLAEESLLAAPCPACMSRRGVGGWV
ncbi:arylsulfotransferase family protein [Streptomyces sp. 6N223]|uniref:arylsulfotransferase family protein n=1 Tax=Streptomyces sp. 6N223 TaxID=3457412 RepID=UPI003FCF93CF